MDDFFRHYEPTSHSVEEEPLINQASDFFGSYPVQGKITEASLEESSPVTSESLTKPDPIDDKGEVANILNELNELIGLDLVKQEILGLINFVRIREMRRLRGLPIPDLNLHAVFFGPPGTGKTTVARLYGRLFKALGLLSSGHLIETDRAGLVAEFIGQTAVKTEKKLQDALGGVLFIDEAYTLSKRATPNDFGTEAIEIILKRMEDYRDDLAIIAAGYDEPMAMFLEANEGLKSRFMSFVHFESFSEDQLLTVFARISSSKGYILGNGVQDRITEIIRSELKKHDPTFGNARFIRNLFQRSIFRQSERLTNVAHELTDQELSTIEIADVVHDLNIPTQVVSTLGFRKNSWEIS